MNDWGRGTGLEWRAQGDDFRTFVGDFAFLHVSIIVGDLRHLLRGVQLEAVVTFRVSPKIVRILGLKISTIGSKCCAQLVFAV